MRWNNDLNTIELYQIEEDIHNNYFNSSLYTSIFPSDSFTSLYLDVEELGAGSLGEIDITIIGCGVEIDFKTITDSSDLLFSNNKLIFKNTTSFSQDLEGIFYLKLSTSNADLFSNHFLFGAVEIEDSQVAEMYIDYISSTDNDPIEIKLKASESVSITVNWGDGTDTTQTVGTTETTFSKSYSIEDNYKIGISQNLKYVTSLTINNSRVTAIDTLDPLIAITDLNLNECSLLSLPLNEVNTIVNLQLADTLIDDIFSASQSPLQTLDISRNYKLQGNFSDNNFVSKLTSLHDLTIDECQFSSIAGGAVGQNNYIELHDFNAANNNFSYIPSVGLEQSGSGFEDVEVWDLSYNYLIGDVRAGWMTSGNASFIMYPLKYDFSYNNLNNAFIDWFLFEIADNHTDLANIEIVLDGYSRLNGINNETPTLGIEFYEVITGGSGFSNGDTIEPTNGGGTGCICEVNTNQGTGIKSLVITTAGSGYTSLPTTFITSGSGTGYDIELLTSKLKITESGGIVTDNL